MADLHPPPRVFMYRCGLGNFFECDIILFHFRALFLLSKGMVSWTYFLNKLFPCLTSVVQVTEQYNITCLNIGYLF